MPVVVSVLPPALRFPSESTKASHGEIFEGDTIGSFNESYLCRRGVADCKRLTSDWFLRHFPRRVTGRATLLRVA